MAEGVALILGLILLGVGLLLAFFGRAMWETLMVIIGGFIGWFLAYFFASYIMGWEWWLALIVGLIGGLIGSYIFGALVEIALALIVGLLAGGITYILGGPGWAIPAVIIFVVVFAIAYYYMDDLIAVITALIGGLLSALAIYMITIDDPASVSGGEFPDPTMAILAGIGIFIAGAIVQMMFIKDSDRNIRRR